MATPTFANASVRSFGEARSTTGSVRSESVAMYSFSRVATCSWNIVRVLCRARGTGRVAVLSQGLNVWHNLPI